MRNFSLRSKILSTLAGIAIILTAAIFIQFWSLGAKSRNTQPTEIGLMSGKLSPCGPKPNCVASGAELNSKQYIEPLTRKGTSEEDWQNLKSAILSLPNSKIITDDAGYLHATIASSLFGFIDDIEAHLDLAQNNIQIRSASRVGYSDFGANRSRIEQIRELTQTSSRRQ